MNHKTFFSFIKEKKTYVPIASCVIKHIIKTNNLSCNEKLYYIMADLLSHIREKRLNVRNISLSGTTWATILKLSESRVFHIQKKLETLGYFLIKRSKDTLNRHKKNIIIPTLPNNIFKNLNKKDDIKHKSIKNKINLKRSYLDKSKFFVKINYPMFKTLIQEKKITSLEKLIWIYYFLKSYNNFEVLDTYKNIASFFSFSESII